MRLKFPGSLPAVRSPQEISAIQGPNRWCRPIVGTGRNISRCGGPPAPPRGRAVPVANGGGHGALQNLQAGICGLVLLSRLLPCSNPMAEIALYVPRCPATQRHGLLGDGGRQCGRCRAIRCLNFAGYEFRETSRSGGPASCVGAGGNVVQTGLMKC